MRLDITLDVRSIDAAIRKLNDYAARIKKLETELPRALCDIGQFKAQAIYDTAPYNVYLDGSSDKADIVVSVEPVEGGYVVKASGEAVCFVEFGAGVFYNGADAYQGTRPEGIVGIGEYGSGKGKRKAWGFPGMATYVDANGKTRGNATHGTPASNALYYASVDMRERIAEEARKILTK